MSDSASPPSFWRVPRAHRWVLATLLLVGLLRGLFWSVTIEIWSPVDEAQHYSYVDALAEGRLPIIGEDHVPDAVLRVALETAVGATRSQPLRPAASDERWGATREQYEAGQPPLYYLAVAPVQRLGEFGGVRASIFVTRAASVAVSLVAVLVAYALARELFPRRRAVWVLAPGLLVLVGGFNTNLAAVTNDALVPATAAAMIPAARAIRYAPTTRRAVTTGVCIGAALLVKSTALPVPLYVAAGAGAAVWLGRWPLRRAASWLATAAGVSAVVYLPWVAWNLVAYGSPTAAEEVLTTITGPLQRSFPLSPRGIWQHLELATSSYWNGQVVPKSSLVDFMLLDTHTIVWSVAVLLAAAAGLAVAFRRRTTAEWTAVGWLLATAPITIVTFLALVYATLDGAEITIGRMMYPTLVPLVVLIAGGLAVAFERRAAVVAAAGLAAVALSFEPTHVRNYTNTVYASGLYDGLTPVVDQWRNDGWEAGTTVRFEPPCEAHAIGLTFVEEDVPRVLDAEIGGIAAQLRLAGAPDWQVGAPVGVYRLDAPTRETIRVELPAQPQAGRRAIDRNPHVAFDGLRGDPVARIYCESDDPAGDRFAQTFAINHPDGITLAMLHAWPFAWLWLARLGFLAAVFWALRGGSRR